MVGNYRIVPRLAASGMDSQLTKGILIMSSHESKPHDQAIRLFLEDQCAEMPDLFQAVHDEDEMWLFALHAVGGDRRKALLGYFSIGHHTFGTITQIVN